jgi:targeting protein for Xklp2
VPCVQRTSLFIEYLLDWKSSFQNNSLINTCFFFFSPTRFHSLFDFLFRIFFPLFRRPSFPSDSKTSSSPPREEPKPEPFKARPLNKKIFESSGEIGVPRVEKRQPTIPESPQFNVNFRAAMRRNPAPEEVRAMEEEELRQAREFKAGPITHYAFKGGHRQERHMPTIPHSPALSTKERAHMRPQAEDIVHKEVISHEFKARPMKIVEQPFVPKLGEVHLTEPIPFDLATERRRIEEEQRLQDKVEEERRQLEAARNFKARPVPKKALQNPFKPHLDLKVTEPEPFELESVQKHELYQEHFHEMIDEEERVRRENMEFKARAFKHSKPFITQRSTKPLTTLDDVVLNSDVRASHRREFDNKLLAKEIAQQEADRKRQILEKERQKQEVKKLRQQLVHKPLPVPDTMYRVGFIPKPSDQPLTAPKTPIFGLDKKRRRLVGRDI